MVTPLGIRCASCAPKQWQTSVIPIGAQAMMRLQIAAVMYSLMLAKLLSIVTPCFG
jgi:hypothetical protein